MTVEILKQLLLSYNVFLDNEYLTKYAELVFANLGNALKPGLQKHHVIPVKYYSKWNVKLTRAQVTKIAEADKNNFCILLSRELHAIAHCYLALASKECWFTSLNLSAIGLLGYDNSDPELLLSQIETDSLPKAKRCWIHRGEQNKNINVSYLPQYLEADWQLKSYNRHKRIAGKKTETAVWMHLAADKLKIPQSKILEYLKLGYKLGMSDDTRRQTCFVNNEVENRKISLSELQNYLETGWKFGKIIKNS